MKFKPGPLAGELSGSIGNLVASHNRYGAYFRSRVIPVNPNTIPQQKQRGILSTASGNWRTLDANTRLAWKSYAAGHTVIDNLGAAQTLSSNALATMLNCRLLAYNNSLLTLPPVADAPRSLTSFYCTSDMTATPKLIELDFLPTPIGATHALYIRACLANSPTITFVEGRLKFIMFSALNQATDPNIFTNVEAVLGTPQLNQYIHVTVAIFDSTTALLSRPLYSVRKLT